MICQQNFKFIPCYSASLTSSTNTKYNYLTISLGVYIKPAFFIHRQRIPEIMVCANEFLVDIGLDKIKTIISGVFANMLQQWHANQSQKQSKIDAKNEPKQDPK